MVCSIIFQMQLWICIDQFHFTTVTIEIDILTSFVKNSQICRLNMASCLSTLEEQHIHYLMDSHGIPQQWADMCMAKIHFSIGLEPHTCCNPV